MRRGRGDRATCLVAAGGGSRVRNGRRDCDGG